MQPRSLDHASGLCKYPVCNCLEHMLPACDTLRTVLALRSLTCYWWKGWLLLLLPIYWCIYHLWWGLGWEDVCWLLQLSWCLVQELICGMLGILKVCRMRSILKFVQQVWVTLGDAEWVSRDSHSVPGSPTPPALSGTRGLKMTPCLGHCQWRGRPIYEFL